MSIRNGSVALIIFGMLIKPSVLRRLTLFLSVIEDDSIPVSKDNQICKNVDKMHTKYPFSHSTASLKLF